MSIAKPDGNHARDGVGEVLRSITPLTGGLAGGLAVAVPMLAATIYEMNFGRPSSTAGLAIPFAMIWGGLAAAAGAAGGRTVRDMVQRSRWAGPSDPGVAAFLVLLVVAIPTLLALSAVFRMQAENAPRAIRSSGEISRAPGRSALVPAREAAFLWVRFPHPNHPTADLQWNGRRVNIAADDDRLVVTAGDLPPATIDISRFDEAREVYGITARLASSGQQWLALLVQLRSTSGRELLFIFNPQGVLVHEELLERQRGPVPRVGLIAAGPADRPQEIVLHRGVPVRYFVNAGAAR